MILDLSTAVFADNLAKYENGKWTSTDTYIDAIIPSLVLDPAKTYVVEIDYEDTNSSGLIYLYSAVSGIKPDGFSNSTWYELASSNTTINQGTVSFTIGPGLSQWNDAVAAGEHYVIFEIGYLSAITGIRVSEEGGGSTPPNPPINLSASNVTARSIDLDWEKPSLSDPTSYEYRVNGGATTSVIDTSASISNLSPWTNYTIEVRSVSGSDVSNWVSIVVSTLSLVPPPINLEAVGISAFGFSVFWDPPNDPEAIAPESYEYRIDMGLRVNVGLDEDVQFKNLVADTTYLFEIRSIADGEYSSWASLTVKTLPIYERISWSPVNPHYHHGVDQGVLYPLDGPGVAWNGLVSVEDAHVGGEFEPVYMDGIKRLNLPSGRNYQATLSAYSTPEEFGPCNGEINVMKGLILTRQPRQHFGFSYRTMVGDSGYQIHLVYNALATPTGRSYTTKTDAPSPSIPTWTIDALPVSSKAPRPTAHYILDSTEIGEDQMAVIESLLYGADDRNAYLPSIGQIAAIATNWDPQVIEPNNISGLHSLSDGMGDVQETDVYGVYISIPTGRLTETEVKGLFQLTE